MPPRRKLLPQEFYDRDPREVARDLLGKVLVRKLPDGKRASGRIVEVEAYLGEGDLAAHSAAGVTARNRVIFGPPGHAYVYFIYGMYYCLNFTCLKPGQAGCVLLRALEPLDGVAFMARERALDPEKLRSPAGMRLLTSGPGRACEALGITRDAFNGAALYTRSSQLQIVDDVFHPRGVAQSARIGIVKAAEMPLRYFISGNPFVSGSRKNR
jgi:DNA-3-methyladenine glycosylase